MALIIFSLILNISSLLWADEELDIIAKDNVPSWFLESARENWETANGLSQQSNERLGEEFFKILTEDEIVRWTYTKADLDGTKSEDYLLIIYGAVGGTNTFVILKKENDSYPKLWELPADSVFSGSISTADITLDDIDADNKPEINVSLSSGNPGTDFSYLIKWQWQTSYLLEPRELVNAIFIDLDRDGIKETLEYRYETEDIELPDGSIERKYNGWYDVSKFNGLEYVFYKEIIQEENRSFSLLASTQAEPLQWDLRWAGLAQNARMKNIKTTLDAIEENHNVDEIDLSSLRLEERITPLQTFIEDNKLIAEFDKREVMTYLLESPRKEPLQPGDKIDITISALLESCQYVSGSSEVEIIESLESTAEIQPNKWNIHWLDKDDKKQPAEGKINCYLGNITGHNVDDVLIETILLNDSVPVSEHGKKEKAGVKTKKHRKNFEGDILEIKFNKFDAIKSLGEIKIGDIVTVIVTGKLSDGKTFIGEDTLQIIGSEPED